MPQIWYNALLLHVHLLYSLRMGGARQLCARLLLWRQVAGGEAVTRRWCGANCEFYNGDFISFTAFHTSQIMFTVMQGSNALGTTLPTLSTIAQVFGCARHIFEVIDSI